MIKVLKDNTKEIFYTKCKNCGSELQYEYSDINTKEIVLSYNTDKCILCPVCRTVTIAELETKETYRDTLFSFKPSNSGIFPLTNCSTFKGDKNGE